MKKTFLLLSLLAIQFFTLLATASEAARSAALLPDTTILLINQDVHSQGAMAKKLEALSKETSFLSAIGEKATPDKAGRFNGVFDVLNLLQNVFKDKDCKVLFLQCSAVYPQSNSYCFITEVENVFNLAELKEQLAKQAAKDELKITIQDGKAAGIPYINIIPENHPMAIAIVDGGKTFLAAPEKTIQECLMRYKGKQPKAVLSDRMKALKAIAKAPANAAGQLLVDITPEMQSQILKKSDDAENPMIGATMDPFSKLSGFAMVCSLEENSIPLKLFFQANQEADALAFKTQILDGMIVAMLPILTPALNLTTPPDFATNLKTSQEGKVASLTTAFSINDIDIIIKMLKQMVDGGALD